MCCICGQYGFDEESRKYQNYWKFQKDIYMGELYKCTYCGTLWAKYMSGHGWMTYYKKSPDSNFDPPSPVLQVKKQAKYLKLDEMMMKKWKEFTESLPNEKEGSFENVRVPSDIMSVLKFLFKDEKKIRGWLFTCREKSMQFELPVNIMKEEDGMDMIRFILLKKCYNNFSKLG